MEDAMVFNVALVGIIINVWCFFSFIFGREPIWHDTRFDEDIHRTFIQRFWCWTLTAIIGTIILTVALFFAMKCFQYGIIIMDFIFDFYECVSNHCHSVEGVCQ